VGWVTERSQARYDCDFPPNVTADDAGRMWECGSWQRRYRLVVVRQDIGLEGSRRIWEPME
jgi:hypothetical protein